MTKDSSKLLIFLVIVLVVIIIGGTLYYEKKGCSNNAVNVLPAQEVGDGIVSHINENFPEAPTSLVGVSEEAGLYKLTLRVGENESPFYATLDGKFLFTQWLDLSAPITPPEPEPEPSATTIGNFSVSEDTVCEDGGKPIVYFFGSETCPHCVWEHPVIKKVVEKFGDNIVFHDNMDSQETDGEIFAKYSTGGIPAVVIGCKYYRVGSGETSGEDGETTALTALICKLTNSQPSEVCGEVQGLIDQI